MKFYEIKIALNLKNKIHFQKAPEAISKMIATHLINSGYDKHDENIIKNYVFSNLGRAGKDGYFEGKAGFTFRTFDREIANYMMDIDEYEDKIFKVTSANQRAIKQRRINKLISLNPVFITVDGEKGEFWTYKHDLGRFLTSLQNNLLKKHRLITGSEPEMKHGFIQNLLLKNTSPFSYYYKNKRFLGFKVEIVPQDDELSQALAFVALGAGLGEKNSSVGGGFCRWE